MELLMIDDDEDTNFLMGLLFEREDRLDSFHIENDPVRALEKLQNKEISPDYIFVDLTMPGLSGYEFVEKFQQSAGKWLPGTEIYILSSSARESDRKKINQYSCIKEFILKPLSMEKLRKIIAHKVS